MPVQYLFTSLTQMVSQPFVVLQHSESFVHTALAQAEQLLVSAAPVVHSSCLHVLTTTMSAGGLAMSAGGIAMSCTLVAMSCC